MRQSHHLWVWWSVCISGQCAWLTSAYRIRNSRCKGAACRTGIYSGAVLEGPSYMYLYPMDIEKFWLCTVTCLLACMKIAIGRCWLRARRFLQIHTHQMEGCGKSRKMSAPPLGLEVERHHLLIQMTLHWRHGDRFRLQCVNLVLGWLTCVSLWAKSSSVAACSLDSAGHVGCAIDLRQCSKHFEDFSGLPVAWSVIDPALRLAQSKWQLSNTFAAVFQASEEIVGSYADRSAAAESAIPDLKDAWPL